MKQQIEIERSWLISSSAELSQIINDITPRNILTGMVNPLGSGMPYIRYRSDKGKFTLDSKTPDPNNELVRLETNSEITENEFEQGMQTVAEIYDESRYEIQIADGLVAELKVYSGELTGCNVIEVEFENVQQSDNFTPPNWFGKEITGMDVIEIFKQFREQN